MIFELWWLLAIPLVFALGWTAARIDVRQMLNEQGALPRSYFKGLNFLLNEQPDKAIDAFVEVARLDPETVELHFALGSLFRRRGETERAIRVHQNLVNRPDLPVNERDHALYELGQDFLRAGMLDRAEESLRMLMAGEYALPSKRVLLELYQVEKEWRKAIEAARELRQAGDDGYTVQIAQFCCELAQECIAAKAPEEAVQWLEQALSENPANVRANILLGDVSLSLGQPVEALQRWKGIEQQNAAYLPLVAERIMKTSIDTGDGDAGLAWLRRQFDSRLGGELLDVAYKYEREIAGTRAALQTMRQQMRRQPSFGALTKVYEAEVELAGSTDEKGQPEATGNPETTLEAPVGDLVVARDLLKQRTRNLARYTCHECGFRARLFYWQCPGCSRWETYAPRRAEVAASGGASM